MRPQVKKKLSQLRRWRIRKKVSGTAERPRMAVKFTGEHIYVQFIDDVKGVTLASMSTRCKTIENRDQLAANKASAKVVGKAAGEAAKAKGISVVVFDRAGAKYHGKVKELADAAREAGLKF
ncbi:MAG: 50S ribosomal protein L18 [Verrucomicrobia bacterium]|nr:50S ribosomal protein L18 [Verrucomicrobiota bacterium]